MPRRTFIRVSPDRIVITPQYLRPSHWDTMAVLADLVDYVSRSRLINGCPELVLVDGILYVESGEPFVHAARKATPPIEELLCGCAADEALLRALGIRPLSASALLDEVPASQPFKAWEMLFFLRPVPIETREAIQGKIEAFFQRVQANPEWGGDYQDLGDFEWNDAADRLTWEWVHSETEGRHVIALMQLIADIHETNARVRSRNGIVWLQSGELSPPTSQWR